MPADETSAWTWIGRVMLGIAAIATLGAAVLLGKALFNDDPGESGAGLVEDTDPAEREPVVLPGTEIPLPQVAEPEELEPTLDDPPAPSEVVPPVVENPGVPAPGEAEDERVADAPAAPPEVIEECSEFFSKERDDRMRARLKEGLMDPDFAVAFRGMVNPYALMSLMCLPNEDVTFSIFRGDGVYEASADAGEVHVIDPSKAWKWTAPSEPGIYCVKIRDQAGGSTMCLHGMVCVPYNGEAALEGYQIGKYETRPLRNNPRYKVPRGFIRVNKEDRDVWVSPHLQLGQFVCKQASGYPKFMLLETRLLLKLEAVIAKLRTEGIEPDTLYVTSGYRTPHYNRALGNKTRYSRHLYGDAADVFVDTDGDYRLDDLNGDGRANDRDALYLSSLIDSVSDVLPEHFVGGLGFYGFLTKRTAFVHTDTRGYEARWGFRTGKSTAATGPPPLRTASASASSADPGRQ